MSLFSLPTFSFAVSSWTHLAKGDKRRWLTINEELSTHMRTTMVLTNDERVIYHPRHSGAPESNQKEIYRLLGIKDTLLRIKRIATHL